MKSKQLYFLLAAFLLFFLPSCNEDNIVEENKLNGDAIVIDAGMTTRAVDAEWEPGDEIGVTMYNTGYTEMIDGIYNTPYTTTSSGMVGEFNAVTESQTLYFPQTGEQIRLNAYYPYTPDVPSTMRIPWNVTDQTVLQDIDLMTAVHQAGFSKYETYVKLHFYHRLTKLIFELSVDENEQDEISLEDCELTIRNVEYGNTYDLVADRFLNLTQGTGDIEIPQRQGEPSNYRQAILLPRTAGQGVVFDFKTTGGNVYSAYMSPELALESGNQYTFRVVLSANEVTISATIEPWVERDPISYRAMNISTPAGDTQGVNIGDVMTVYVQNEAGTAFDLLRRFTYQSVNNWVPETPVYWEDIPTDPTVFRASIIAEQPLNNTQLPDILIAEDVTVDHTDAVNFTLYHAVSKVSVALLSETFTGTQLANATITLPGYLGGGQEVNGEFVPGTTRQDVTIYRNEMGTSVALFQPQTIAGTDPLVRITIAGENYDVYEPDGFTFEPGVAYQLIIDVNEDELYVSATVVDWDEEILNLTAFTPGVGAGSSEGVLNGEVMNVYIANGADRDLLNTYTYQAATDSFLSDVTIYWESLPSPSTFYASILRTVAYNNTQIDDYLVAEPVVESANNGVHFELSHASARVEVQLTSRDDTFSKEEREAMTLTLPDYIKGGTVVNGLFVQGTDRGAITVQKNVGDDGDSALAFIDPQTVPAGETVIEITSANRTYPATYPDDIVFEPNKSTVLRIDLSKTGVTLSASVKDWTEQTATLTVEGITVEGELDVNSDFFKDKTIYVYRLDDSLDKAEYTYQNTGSGYNWTGPVLYWDDQASFPINLTAVYYPAGEAAITNNSFPWLISPDQNQVANNYYTNYDLLTSHQQVTQPSAINFEFTHATSKVEVNLIPGVGFDASELVGARVVLNDYFLNGTVNLNTGVIGNFSNAQDVMPKTDTDGKAYSALVMPQTKIANQPIVTITIPAYPNTPFVGRMDRDLLFNAGQITEINVTLNKTVIELSATLKEWVEGDEGNINIQ